MIVAYKSLTNNSREDKIKFKLLNQSRLKVQTDLIKLKQFQDVQHNNRDNGRITFAVAYFMKLE